MGLWSITNGNVITHDGWYATANDGWHVITTNGLWTTAHDGHVITITNGLCLVTNGYVVTIANGLSTTTINDGTTNARIWPAAINATTGTAINAATRWIQSIRLTVLGITTTNGLNATRTAGIIWGL